MNRLPRERSRGTSRAVRWALSAMAVALVAPTSGATSAPPMDVALERVTGGFSRPVYVTGDPSRPGTLFVVEQNGRVRVVVDGRRRKAPFIDIRRRVSARGEQGLLSIALDPEWPERRFVFVNYTDRSGDTVVERYTARKNLRRVQRKSRLVILKVAQPFTNHNGGQLQFGPDGYLYIGMGDGGGGGDPLGSGQDLTSLLGKMLRIDVSNGRADIPRSNPRLPGVGRTAIWALGLRNPWRFSFDRRRGDLYIADVGQDEIEEIDFAPASDAGGRNYGWPIREGSQPFDSSVAPAVTPLREPIHEYDRRDGSSITGGYVYRGDAIPELAGYYVFADFASQRIWAFEARQGRPGEVIELTSALVPDSGEPAWVSSFGEDAEGALYLCDYFAGVIYRIVPSS